MKKKKGKAIRQLIFIFIAFGCCINFTLSQKPIALNRVFSSATHPIFFPSTIKVKDTTVAKDTIRQTLKILNKAAYFLAQTDSVVRVNDSVMTAYFRPGKQYKWATLKAIDFPPRFWSSIEPDVLKLKNRPIQSAQLMQLEEAVLQKAENNGFPFAAIRFLPIRWNEEHLEGRLVLQLGNQIVVDSIHIEGKSPVSKTFIEKYLGIKNGSLYDKSKIIAISKRLKELPFLKETKSSIQIFQGNGVCIHLFLENQNASRFDGVLGLLPKSTDPTLSTSGKLTITGTLLADLYNLLNKGERFVLDFQQLRPETQQLRTRGIYPYLFKTNFGID